MESSSAWPYERVDSSWSQETTPSSSEIGPVDEFVRHLRETPPRTPHRIHRGIVKRRPRKDTRESHMPQAAFDLTLQPVLAGPSNHAPEPTPSSATFAFLTSASPSSSPWNGTGFIMEEEEEEDDDDDDMDVAQEEPEAFDSLLVPKIESPDDEVLMDDLQEAEGTIRSENGMVLSPSQTKRPRGRPRKHPVQSLESLAKVAKGRSKTGCITCRKRKKKCDEAKPRCLNCEKNAVLCEGYPERTVWKSGKEKKEEAQLRRVSLPNIKLHPVIHGVETTGDRIFFEHYVFRLSAVLTVEGPTKNAFKDMLLPMAVKHLGLMHSILALSSTNIDYNEPYGKELLTRHPDLTKRMLEERSQFHQDEALKEFHADIARQREGVVENAILSVRYGQMLCMVVQSLAEGKATGEHRIHLQGYQKLIRESPPEDGPFMEFIKEYFQFHIALDELISPPRLPSMTDDSNRWNLNLPENIIQPDAVRLLGVQDRLFDCMSKVTTIRNTIRTNMDRRVNPVVDYTSLYRAAEIDAEIRDWAASWAPGDSREVAGLLYKQMVWVYLWRTIYPPKANLWEPDPKITQAVNDGIVLLDLIPPNDPSQTLLLAPSFLIGCAAFEEVQRGPIRRSIATIKNYTHLKNTDRAIDVLEEVWRLMDAKDERSWDWQAIAQGMNMDFLAT